jgi:hypothetical protein
VGELVVGAGEADLEAFDLAQPAFAFGLVDAGQQVVADLLQARLLRRVWMRTPPGGAWATAATAAAQRSGLWSRNGW